MNPVEGQKNLSSQRELTLVVQEQQSVSKFEAQDLSSNQQIKYPSNQSNSEHTSSYRPDIDGLRTIAITLVLVYHAFPQYLPGGFIGVDIFFVISGYLISQIIIKQSDIDKFSYPDFYARRVKRIYPALMLVLFFTLYTVAMRSQKDQLKLTLGTFKAATVFGANIEVLNYKKGYFDAELRVNPLLHLWSLGVEEQFYIVWPFLLSWAIKFCKKWTLAIIGLYAGISFALQIANTYSNPKFAFYFPLCRFWQMAIGGILAYTNFNIKSAKINNYLSFSAIGILSITVFILNDSSEFPGFWALIPTLCSAFIIQAKESFINKHILSSKPFVGIGKISYSLYLWHWPFLILCHTYYPYGSKSLWANSVFILIIVVGVSIATYFMAEDPVRKIKGKRAAIGLLILMAAVLYTGFWVQQNILNKLDINQDQIVRLSKAAEEQMKPRDPQDYYTKNNRRHSNPSISKSRKRPTLHKLQINYLEEQYDNKIHGKEFILDKDIDKKSFYYSKEMERAFRHYEVSNEGQDKIVLLVGDSHNSKITHRFQQLYKQSLLKFTPFPTLVSLVRWGMFDFTGHDIIAQNLILQFVDKHHPKRVMLTKHWLQVWCGNLDKPFNQPHDCDIQRAKNIVSNLTNFIIELQKRGCEVSISDVAVQLYSLSPNQMKDGSGSLIEENLKPFKLSDHIKKYEQFIKIFHDGLKPLNVDLVTLTDNHCYEDICQRFTPSGHPIYGDSNHFTKFFVRHWMTSVDHIVDF